MSGIKKIGTMLIVACLAASIAQAAEHTWTGGGTAPTWAQAANWSSIPAWNDETALFFYGEDAARLEHRMNAHYTINSLTYTANAISDVKIGFGALPGPTNPRDLTMAGTNPHITVMAGSTGNHDLGWRSGNASYYGSLILNNDLLIAHNGSGNLLLSNPISEDATARGITKTGTGRIELFGENTYTGTTTIQGGVVQINNASSLGSGAGGTVIESGATVQMQGAFTTAENFNIAGIGPVGTAGALRVQGIGGGNPTLTGLVTLDGDAMIAGGGSLTLAGGVATEGHELTVAGAVTTEISGAVTGSGRVIASTVSLTLSAANSYSGGTVVNNLLVLGEDGTLGSGNITINASGTLDVSAKAGGLTVASGTAFGGGGTVVGDVTLSGGALLAFSPIATLAMDAGSTLAFADVFSVADLAQVDGSAIDWGTIGNGTYALVSGSVDFTNVDTSNYDLGSGRYAFFEQDSLNLTVIPEPATMGMVVLSAFLMLAARRIRI